MAKLPFRKIKFWAIYDPKKREIVKSAKFKYLLPVPSRASGWHLVELTGFYPSVSDAAVKP